MSSRITDSTVDIYAPLRELAHDDEALITEADPYATDPRPQQVMKALVVLAAEDDLLTSDGGLGGLCRYLRTTTGWDDSDMHHLAAAAAGDRDAARKLTDLTAQCRSLRTRRPYRPFHAPTAKAADLLAIGRPKCEPAGGWPSENGGAS